MLLGFRDSMAPRTLVGIGSLRAYVLFLGAGIKPAMNRLGTGDTFKRIKSKESRLESNKVQRLPDSIRPAMFVLEVLTMFFALDGSADPMRVVRRDPDTVN
jgi:hypothetical protein